MRRVNFGHKGETSSDLELSDDLLSREREADARSGRQPQRALARVSGARRRQPGVHVTHSNARGFSRTGWNVMSKRLFCGVLAVLSNAVVAKGQLHVDGSYLCTVDSLTGLWYNAPER